MIENYSIELFPDHNEYPYLHSLKIPYISKWEIKFEELNVHSKSLNRPSIEEWIEILKLELVADKHPMQKSIEKYFKLDSIQQRILNVLVNKVTDVQYNLLSKSHHNKDYLYLYDQYTYNINGNTLYGEGRRILGGHFLERINDIDKLKFIKENFYD